MSATRTAATTVTMGGVNDQDGDGVVLRPAENGVDGNTDQDWEEDEESDDDDLWDFDGEMTAEMVTAALAETKKRKKARAKAAKEKAMHGLCLSHLRGDSNLAWKEEIAAKRAARDPRRILQKMTEAAKSFAHREWQLVKHDIEEFVTPAWITQEKQRAEYLHRIARAERRMGRIYADLAAVRTKQKKAKRAEFVSWKKRKQEIKHLQLKDRFLGTLVETTKAEERAQALADFKRRVEIGIKERRDKETERLEAHKNKRADEKTARRSTILKFWGQAQHELRDEASVRSSARKSAVQYREQGRVANLRDEDTRRQASRREDQLVGPWGFENVKGDGEGGGAKDFGKKKTRFSNAGQPAAEIDPNASHQIRGDSEQKAEGGSTGGDNDGGQVLRQGMTGIKDGLGVFEISMDDGDRRFKGGDKIDVVDSSEIQPLQPLQHAAHEERWTKLYELEAEVGRTEALYAAVTEEGRVAEEEGASLTAVRTRLEREMVQIDEEHSAMMQVQRLGNRDLNPAEVEAMHLRKTRKAVIRDSLREAHERYIKSAATRKATEAQGLKLARQLAVMRERARANRENLESENRGLGSLPVIVGRSVPRVVAAARLAGVEASGRAPPFEQINGSEVKTTSGRSNVPGTQGTATRGGGVTTEDMIAGNPRRAMDELSLRTKLEMIRGEVEATLKMHSTMAKGERSSWLKQIERQNEENTYQALVTRLARATERLKLVDGENARESLSTAIQLFSVGGGKALLESPVIKHMGLVPWWRFRDKNESCGVEKWRPPDVEDAPPPRQERSLVRSSQPTRFPEEGGTRKEEGENNIGSEKGAANREIPVDHRDETMGISLGPVAQGHLVGSMPMPTNGLWTVRLAVTRRLPEDAAGESVLVPSKHTNPDSQTRGDPAGVSDFEEFNHDPTDWVSVRMGTSLATLHHVAEVKNIVNEDLGEMRYEMSHHFRGSQLAYCFDFSSSSILPEAHMSVEPGLFATFEVAPLEWVGNHAISSYVKEVRLDLRSPEASTMRLLEDMIQAETADGPTWDSSALHATLQRYPRQEYCRLVRETLEDMQVKAAQSKVQEARLADIYKTVIGGDSDDRGSATSSADKADLLRKHENMDPAEAEKHMRLLHPDERRAIRSMRSNSAYLKRKRDAHRHRVAEAETMVGKKIEIFDGAANVWRTVVISAVSLRWIDLGTRLILRHVVRVLGTEEEGNDSHNENKGGNNQEEIHEGGGGEEASKIGPATIEVDLDEVRWAECTVREPQRLPSKADTKKLAEPRVSTIEAVVQKAQQALAILQEEFEGETQILTKTRSIEDRATRMAEDAEIKQVEQQTKTESEILVASQSKAKAEVQRLARSLHSDWKLGIGKPQSGKEATKGVALAEARRKWVEDKVATAVGRSQQGFKFLKEETADRRRREDEGLQRAFRAKTEAVETARDEEVTKLKRLASIERERLIKEELGIPGFEKALQANIGCSHVRTKAWGDKYGSGLRCRDCGMEATRMHKDVRQAKGIGFGEDPILVEAVERHRANEGGFQFETSAQLKEVEEERIRLEKERRVCFAEYDHMFYDLDDPEMMYELDRRHRHWLKENGVIRQGVLWRKEELLAWFDKRAQEGDTEAKEMKGVMIAWYDNTTRSGPLTYRTYDGRRKARFLDILSIFNRINNSKIRIAELEDLRRQQAHERVEFRQIIKRAHSDIPLLEMTTSRAEAELGECQRMLEMRKEADRQHRHWHDMLEEVKKDLTHAEMRLAGQDFLVATANAKLRDATEQLREILLHRLRSEARIAVMEKRHAVVKANRQKHTEDHARLTHEIELFYYTKRDSHVVTPIGWATVNSYREEDQMLIVTLPYGRPAARMWIPVEKVWQLDRAGQQAENVGMRAEDERSRQLLKNDRATMARECWHMLTEETATREVLREEAEIEDEKRLAAKIVAQAKVTAPRLATMSAVSEHRNRWVAYQVRKAVEQRAKDVARWETKTDADDDDSIDPQTKPSKVKGPMERALMAAKYRNEFVQVYIKAFVKNAELKVEKMLELRAKDRAEATILDYIIGTYLAEFVKDVAQETLKAGLLAKKRAEDETGLVFPDPSHMQYEVYSIFRSWWVGRKEELVRSVKRWNIVIAKNREKWEREHARVTAVQQSILERGYKDEARTRAAKVCAEMAKEEAATKAFNSWEQLMTLRERRRMMEEEMETRKYMRDLELQEREAERQRQIKSTAEAKEERQKKWLAMTEEERAAFLEEEKEAKKQDWVKKQAVLLGLGHADGDGGSGGIGDGNAYASATSIRERRRLSIKAAKVRGRKREIEIEAMEAEDERSKLENREYLAMLEFKLQQQNEMAKKAAAMRRQMAAEVAAAGGGQDAASIVNSMDSGSVGDGGGDASMSEGGVNVNVAGVGGDGIGGGVGGGGGGAADTVGGPTLFDEDYVSSSESELDKADRAFAEEMGLPTGDGDLQYSEHSSDEENGAKNPRSKKGEAAAAAAAAAAAKAAENSWLGSGGGGGRWGRGGNDDGGDTGIKEDVGENGRNGNTENGNDGAMAASELLAVSDEGCDADDEDDRAKASAEAGDVSEEIPSAKTSTPRLSAGLWNTGTRARKEKEDQGREQGNTGVRPAEQQFLNSHEKHESKVDQDGILRNSALPALSRSSSSSSNDYSSVGWDSSPDDSGDGHPRRETTSERARVTFRSHKLKGITTGVTKGNSRRVWASSTLPPRPTTACGTEGRGGGGGGGRKRRMFLSDVEDSSSTGEETSEEERVRGGKRQSVAVPKRKRGIGGATGDRANKKAKRRAAEMAALAKAEPESLEDDNPEVAELAHQQKILDRRMRHKLGRQRQRVIKRLRRAREIRETEDRKIAMRLEQANQMAQLADAKAELAWLDAEGELRRLDKRLVGEREGLRKLQLFCQVKARVEIACREESVSRTTEARKRQAVRDEAHAWYTKCKEEEHRTLKWKIRVMKETEFFNGRVVTGEYQRWKTDWIYPRLHYTYFKSLVDTLINKAELIGAERRMMKIHDRLVRASQEADKKEALVVKLWKKQRRRELIYLRRSELGKRMFGKSQTRYLRKVFEAWRAFHLWLRSMREAFQLKYGVLKQEMDLNRVYDEIDDGSQRAQNTRPLSGNSGALPVTRKSALHRFKERPIRCRNCQELYLEPQNHDLCCAYHPGEYKRACPRSCPGLTEKCMIHRVMRWTCCDKKEPGTWGSSGCKTRCHFPPFEGHPKFMKISRKGAAEDRGTLAALDRELQKLSSTDVRQSTLQMKQQQLAEIAGKLQKERDVVARYKDLKFV